MFVNLRELVSLKKKACYRDNVLHSGSFSLSGLYASIFRGCGLEYEKVRQYVVGDDLRNIDWKVTAKVGKPQLKVFKEERQRNVIICVDNSSYMNFATRGKFKSVQAANVAALLAWSASFHGDKVGSLIFGNSVDGFSYIPPTMGDKAILRMLNILTKKIKNKKNAIIIDEALKYLANIAKPDTLIFFIADFNMMGRNFEKQLLLLGKKTDIVLLPIIDVADYEIIGIEEAVFVDMEGNEVVLNTNNVNGRDIYYRQWKKIQSRIEKAAFFSKAKLIELSTEEDIYLSIFNGFKSIYTKRFIYG